MLVVSKGFNTMTITICPTCNYPIVKDNEGKYHCLHSFLNLSAEEWRDKVKKTKQPNMFDKNFKRST